MAALSYAVAFHCFILPNTLVPGGFTGIATIIQYALSFSAKWGVYILNIPLLITALIFLPKSFALKTIYTTTMITAILWLFEAVNLPTFDSNVLVAVFVGGILSGISTYFSFSARSSGGGTEIIAQLVAIKRPETDLGKLIAVLNVFIMGTGGFFTGSGKYELWTTVYSILYSCITSLTLNLLGRGIDHAVRFRIITEKPQEMATTLSNVLKRGVSELPMLYPDGTQRTDVKMLLVVVQFRQVYAVKSIIEKIDKNCFAFSSSVDGVVSRPNFNKRYKEWKENYLNVIQR